MAINENLIGQKNKMLKILKMKKKIMKPIIIANVTVVIRNGLNISI